MDQAVDPNHVRMEKEPQGPPDVMNDPAYHPNATKGRFSNAEEPDTCRICRGEGSQEEPLFYPCKCSGSIKFVHQNCLMEWLSHSQKKHCELCKTPFHFTKLYHPHMPNTVPLPVFLHQAAIHSWKSMVTFSRFLLVMLVWAVWLPWCMRTIWRGLFWIGDGAWISWTDRRLLNGFTPYELSTSLPVQGTSSVNQSLLPSKEATASALIAQISNKLPYYVPAFGSNIFNVSSSKPWSLALSQRLYSYIKGSTPASNSSSANAIINITSSVEPISRSTWLSEFHFIKTLTPSPMMNNLLIDTLEGQLITLFVVIAFILVFLIREWVIQQQPIINGGINLNAEGAVAQNAEAPAPQPAPEHRHDDPEGGVPAEVVGGGIPVQGPGARMIARPRPRRPRDRRRPSEQEGVLMDELDGSGNDVVVGNKNEELADFPQARVSSNDLPRAAATDSDQGQAQRPRIPDRNTLAKAAEIRRTIEEYSRKSGVRDSTKEVFEDLWHRAGKEPLEVIKIVEQENMGDELTWVVAAMTKIHAMQMEARMGEEEVSSKVAETSCQDMGRKQPETDDDYIVLDRLSLDSSPERPLDSHSNSAASNIVDREAIPSSPSQIPHAQAPTQISQPTSQHIIPRIAQRGSPSIEGAEGSSIGPIEGQSAELPPQHPSPAEPHDLALPVDLFPNNPFHPEHEGDIPETTSPYNAASNDEPSASTDASQPEIHGNQRVLDQRQIPAVEELPERARTITDTVVDLLWGGVAALPPNPEQAPGDDEHVVNDIAEEAPFVPIDHGQPLRLAANDRAVANQDADVVAAALQAGIDPNEVEPVDEIEDLEGILELVGMQGPLAGLVQNGMFCACLVSLTIFFGVWIPYISGKIFLVLLAHPFSFLFRIPLGWAASTADSIIDLFTFFAGCAIYWTDTIINNLCTLLGLLVPPLAMLSQNKIVAEVAKNYAQGALRRLANSFVATGGILSENDIPMFSVIAHESLQSIETQVAWIIQWTGNWVTTIISIAHDSSSISDLLELTASSLSVDAKNLAITATEKTLSVMHEWRTFLQFNPLRINLSLPPRTTPLDYDLAYWNTKDRTLAIIFGYLFFALLGVLYLHISSRIKGANKNGRIVGGVADGLYQTGGVMKVILIISIEMLVFPLYCGLLLDVALLPLFGNATIMSRINFTLNSPNTSLFLHWFVGTCYMFHFALFVSMCRKVLRSGVLYFIRDPDDPTFHPVRDVLERSVSTQLWKISFSALVYGGLVIICLGGVVWGIAFTFDGVLPIRWSSDEPVLEFPVDLLFYNFLMPLAVKYFKPSKGLNRLFDWWFRKCARALRLTNFLFGEKREDEEGSRIRHKSNGLLHGDKVEVDGPAFKANQQEFNRDQATEPSFHRDGRYVRAPGSDQVRIPKGAYTFLEVDEDDNRLDGQPDNEDGLHGRQNQMFTKVYIPPFFRVRISAFVLFVWLFAAATGVSMTIIPLVFGRFVFATMAPHHLQMNDIYAFSIGLYILGGALYGLLQRHRIAAFISSTLTPHRTTITSSFRRSYTLTLYSLRVLYIYTSFGILLPALLSLLMELYFIIPLHTYFSTTLGEPIPTNRHIIHLIQDWTLGVLYVKMAGRLILWHGTSRPAIALRAVIRNGWLHPDVFLATRGFIFPAILAMAILLGAPLALGWLANATFLHPYSSNDELFKACVYRYSYPGVLVMGFAAATVWGLARAFGGWRKKVRDEVYLIGERLHNFGEATRWKGKGKAVVGATTG